jgi:hypothetical protein
MHYKATCLISCRCYLWLGYVNCQNSWLASKLFVMTANTFEYILGAVAAVSAVGVHWLGGVWDNGQRSH